MINIFKNLYNGKKVLITGHTGFKGSWLTLWLKELGANVAGYSIEPPTNPNLFEAIQLEKKISHYFGDIRNQENLVKIFQSFEPEIVFHLAAQPLVRFSYNEPKLTFDTNIMGTINILETVRQCKSVKILINVTTDKCYENKEWIYGYRENESLGGYDPYSSSKACSEIVTSSYRNSFFNLQDYNKKHQLSLASARAGNVIGGGDWAGDRLIPDCIRALNNKEPIKIRYPDSTRPWQFVLEPLSGYLWLGAMMMKNPIIFSEAWNFGPYDDSIINVEQIVKKVLSVWGNGEIQINSENRTHEAKLLKLDISKATQLLDWKPAYNIDETIDSTILWYKEYYQGNKNKIYDFTVNQLNQYINHAKSKKIAWTQ